MKNLEIYGVQELKAKEIGETDGGILGIRIRGILDGIKDNTEVTLFGVRII